MQPVPHVLALAVDRQALAAQRADDDERDQLLGEMIGAVVVGAVGGEGRQSVSVMPGADEMIGSGLAGGVGRVGCVGRRLGEAPGRAQRTEDLVGRDVLEPETGPCALVERAPIGKDGLEQGVGAADIGLDEGGSPVDRPVDMAFGRQVQDGLRLDFREDRVDRRRDRRCPPCSGGVGCWCAPRPAIRDCRRR